MQLTAGQIGGAGIGSTVGGSLLSAGGNIASGFANAGMYNYNAAVARLNQQIDLQDAEFSRQLGEQQAFQSGLKSAQQLGQIRAGQAASGFDVKSGSNAQVYSSQQKLAQLDQTIIRSNAAKTAYNYEVQGAIAGSQASLYSSAASQSLVAGGIGAASSILGGASSVSSEWLQASRVGMFGPSGAVSGTDWTPPVPTFGA